MKTCMKYVFVGVVSLVIGGVLGWQMFRGQTRQRTFPFDREPFYSWGSDWSVLCPYIELNFTPGGNTFSWEGGAGTIEKDLDSHLARIAHFTTSCWIVVSCNSDVTVQQIRDVDARVRKFGFANPGILIEDNRDNQAGGGKRVFSEIRLGPSMDFD